MSLRPLFLVLTIAAATLLAGCVDDETAPAPTGPDTADDPAATGSTGSVTGQVASASLDYLSDASVFLIIGADIREARTDGDGRFTFNEVAPGLVQVQVSKIGYQSGVTTTKVEANKVSTVSFMLEPLVIKEPFIDAREYVGFYECAFGTIVITDTCTFAWRTAYDEYKARTGQEPPFPRDPQANNENTFFLHIGKDAQAVMTEMVWGAGGGTTEKMMMLLSSTPIHNDCDCSDDDYVDVTGVSPLRAVIGRDLPADRYPADLIVYEAGDAGKIWGEVDAAPNGTVEVAARGFLPFSTSVAYSHAFTMYVSVFYNTIPDADYTAIPDA